MMIRMLAATGCAIAALTALSPATPAAAGNMNSGHGGGFSSRYSGKNQICLPNKPQVSNKTFNFNKTINMNKNIVINKPVTINKNINIEKNIDLSKKIEINKNIEINKTITINKGNNNAEAIAVAAAVAQASAFASASSFSYARGGSSYVTVMNHGGEVSQIAVAPPEEEACVTQGASVVKSIHAECIDIYGESHSAVRMRPETWIDSSESKEIYRCLEGSTLRAVVGDVVQSDHGLAGIYEGGQELVCKSGEALRHFKDGLIKCAVAEKVPDCTERTNLRKYGVGDVFFTYQTQVCARPAMAQYKSNYNPGYSYAPSLAEIQLSGMTLDGGVGQ